ncbi:MAG: GntR family transcriptional regulator [Endozoicomonas sp.]|uniref:GntR family transcriptional regulator n=1 Tax=Endozoicomonas sp. TaxID=1892382 RepID=UPI003D9B03DC
MYEEIKSRAVDLTKTASSSEIIFNALRDEIISGRLPAGKAVKQEHVAKLFNVSRIPVREALMRLESQGLVFNQRHKGYVVTPLSTDMVAEIYELRANLEPLIMVKAVENMTQETLEEARAYCDAFSDETDPARWGEWNRLFHETLYRDSNRPYHLKVIDGAIDRVDPYLRAQLILTDGMDTARKEHMGIFEACAKGDAELAAQLTKEHILESYDALVGYLKQNQSS